jgi:hypothetical protein
MLTDFSEVAASPTKALLITDATGYSAMSLTTDKLHGVTLWNISFLKEAKFSLRQTV